MSIPLLSLFFLLWGSGSPSIVFIPFDRLVAPALSTMTASDTATWNETGWIFNEVRYARRFYDLRRNSPAWVQEHRLTPEGVELLGMLRTSRIDGLDPGNYISADLEEQLDSYFRPPKVGRADRALDAARLDRALTLSFLRYALHRKVGQVNARKAESEWPEPAVPPAFVEELVSGLATGGPHVAVESVEEGNPLCRELLLGLRQYTRAATAGGWPQIPDGPELSVGSAGERVTLLRRRLQVPADGRESGAFDVRLKDAVQTFQKRHGLAPTGAVNRPTLAELNVTVEERIRQIRVNLERARWLPQDFGPRYVLVNIPEATLRFVERGSVVLSMRAVVGTVSRQTPVLADTMTSVVLNPSWNLPPVVIAQDILPRLSEAGAYLKEKNIRVLSGWGKDAEEVDPESIRWDRVSIESMPYRLLMDPGPHNALGRVKFLFPNDEHVYIHDSPQRSLYRKDQRLFSSGCVRVEAARDLASALLRESPRWDEERLDKVLDSGEETSIPLRNPVPIYIIYLTAWVGDDGALHFRPDLYGRDEQLAGLLDP